MPSLVTHLAIAKRHIEFHSNDISNLSDFKKGSIAPDLSSDFTRILSRPEKEITHYYLKSNKRITDFGTFKHNEKIDLTNDYWKGYYIHLLTDHLFYNYFLNKNTISQLKTAQASMTILIY